MWPESGRIAHSMTKLMSSLRATQISMERIMLGSLQLLRSVWLLTFVVLMAFSRAACLSLFRRAVSQEWYVSLAAFCDSRSGVIWCRRHLSVVQVCLEGSRPSACLTLVTLVIPSRCLSTSFVSSLSPYPHTHPLTHLPAHQLRPLFSSASPSDVSPLNSPLRTSPKNVSVRYAVELRCEVSDFVDSWTLKKLLVT